MKPKSEELAEAAVVVAAASVAAAAAVVLVAAAVVAAAEAAAVVGAAAAVGAAVVVEAAAADVAADRADAIAVSPRNSLAAGFAAGFDTAEHQRSELSSFGRFHFVGSSSKINAQPSGCISIWRELDMQPGGCAS